MSQHLVRCQTWTHQCQTLSNISLNENKMRFVNLWGTVNGLHIDFSFFRAIATDLNITHGGILLDSETSCPKFLCTHGRTRNKRAAKCRKTVSTGAPSSRDGFHTSWSQTPRTVRKVLLLPTHICNGMNTICKENKHKNCPEEQIKNASNVGKKIFPLSKRSEIRFRSSAKTRLTGAPPGSLLATSNLTFLFDNLTKVLFQIERLCGNIFRGTIPWFPSVCVRNSGCQAN